MTTAPSIPEMPGQNVGIDVGQSQVNPAWYGYLSGLKKLYDYVKILQPLSDLPAHDATKSDLLRTINNQTGTTYTFALTDSGAYCRFSNSSAVTVTVPAYASVAIPVGAQIDVAQSGTGKVTFAAASGVTINSANGNKSLASRYAGATFIKVTTNEWDLIGSLIP